jgi:very-short-patch-repair endonuclease
MDVGTTKQWAAEGLSPGRLRARVGRGELVRLRHGVYVTAAALATAGDNKALQHALAVRGVLAAVSTPQAAGSHESAAFVHGLPLLHEPAGGTVSITRPARVRVGRSARDVWCRAADLPDRDLMVKHGARVTTVPRTVFDLARTLPFMDAVVVADAAIRMHRVTRISRSRLAEAIKAYAGWPGVDQARRVVGFSDGLSGSPLESCARVIFDAFRLPPPELQAEIVGGLVFRADGYVRIDEYHEYRVDFLWRKYKTVAETDGTGKYYASGRTAIDELKRDRLIREQGYRIVHITGDELFTRPERIIERIEAFSATSAY